jgi:hypothetical protein
LTPNKGSRQSLTQWNALLDSNNKTQEAFRLSHRRAMTLLVSGFATLVGWVIFFLAVAVTKVGYVSAYNEDDEMRQRGPMFSTPTLSGPWERLVIWLDSTTIGLISAYTPLIFSIALILWGLILIVRAYRTTGVEPPDPLP